MGGGGVGKSSLTIRFCKPSLEWIDDYDPTIEDFYRRQTTVDGEPVLCDIIDTAGQEGFAGMRDSWIRSGDAYVIAFDLTDRGSFDSLDEVVARIAQVRNVDSAAKLACIIVANKKDLANKRAVGSAEANEKAASLCCELIEASAKENDGVTDVFDACVRAHRRVNARADAASIRQHTRKLCSIL